MSLAHRMACAGKVKTEHLAAHPGGFVYLARSSDATVRLLKHLTETTRPTIVWSQWSGYLKKPSAITRFCEEQGIEPVVIHSGGHAHPEDLADLVGRLRPSVVVPIHTEAAGQFAALMPNVRVLEDGEAANVASLIARDNQAPTREGSTDVSDDATHP